MNRPTRVTFPRGSMHAVRGESELPESRPRRIFYGWVIVGGLLAVGCVMSAMGGVNFGLFIPPMSEDLGIGQAYFGWAQTARLVGFAASGWWIGRLLDRHGARFPLAVAGLAGAAVIIALSQVTAGWHIVALFFLAGLTGLQAGGGGSLYLSVPLSRWFIARRGRAFAIASLGIPIGIIVLTPVTQLMIDQLGWRAAWAVLGAVGGAVVVGVALVILRKSPESMGLLPDGAAGPANGNSGHHIEGLEISSLEVTWTRAEAMTTRTFWQLAVIDGLRMTALSTLGLFRIPFYIGLGVSPAVVALALSAEGVLSLFAAIPIGWALERFAPRFVSAFATVALLGAFAVTIFASTAAHVFLATMLFGAGAHTFIVSQNVIWPHYFGGLHIGQIRGVAMAIGIAGSALGAPATGMVRDMTGSFLPAWIVAMVLLVITTWMLVFLPHPTTRSDAHPAG
jgi:predicted MFS family arabinose efflux permease